MKKTKGNLTKPTVSPRVKLNNGMLLFETGMSETDEPVAHTGPAASAGSFEQKILMSSLSGIYVYNPTTGVNTFINPQYTRLTGYTLEDLQASKDARLFALIHPEDQKRAAAHLRRVRQAEDDETIEVEYRFKKADGRWMWCLAKEAVFERDGDGRVCRVIGSFLDITEGKTAGKKLENKLRQWSRVFMDAADPIIIEDLSGIIVDMNREAERKFGWTRQELIGKSIRSLVPAERYLRADDLRERCRRGEEVRNWECVRQDQKGERISVLLTAFPLLDESGDIKSVATIAKDITLRKRMEDELEKTHRHLRELSRKSIEALESNRQTIAKEMHDGVAASLAAIKIKLEEIVEQIRQKPQDAAASLGGTIFHLQAVIKETKQIAAELRPTMLDDLGLLSTISWYTRRFSTQFSNIQMKPQIEVREEDIPETQKIVIYRVLQESLNNAAKHSDAMKIDVSLKSDADRIVLEVTDNGRGFDVQKTLDREDPLSGNGLANMIERAEIVGGSLSIDSASGKGTYIRLNLPHEPYAA